MLKSPTGLTNVHNMHAQVRQERLYANPLELRGCSGVMRWYIRMQLRDWVVCVLQRLNRSWSSSKLVLSCSHAYESFLWQKWAFSLRGHVLLNPLLDSRLIFFSGRGKEKAGYCQSVLFSSGFWGSYRGLCVWGESWKCEEVIESMLKNAASLLKSSF